MPTIPESSTLPTGSTSESGARILNAIRLESSPAYQSAVNEINIINGRADVSELRDVGRIFTANSVFMNSFLSTLCNRIAFEVTKYLTYTNPWRVFKKGILELGESIEEIFTALAEPHSYNPETAEETVYRREKPNVKAKLHHINYEKFYKQTIEEKTLRQAFLSWDGFNNLVMSIINAMYNAAEYDEFTMMKYMISRAILNGELRPVNVGTVSKENMSDIVTEIKGISNELEFPDTISNFARVEQVTPHEEQYLITTARFNAALDVEVLAAAFHMDRAEFLGHVIQVDRFDKFDTNRLAKLLENTGFTPFTADELTALASVPAVLVSKEWFMIYDNLLESAEKFNGEGLYRNHWLHVWKTFSTSPFENAVVFTQGAPAITSVTVTPSTVSVSAGQSVQLSATVTSENFADTSVIWETESEYATVNDNGVVFVASGTPASTSITVTCTSVFNSSKTGSATITVS